MARDDDRVLAFDVDDPDFREFLPSSYSDLSHLEWTDFNVHDPGVTTLEAIRFALVDLGYIYDFPLEDLLQKGKDNNPLKTWTKRQLQTYYAVIEDDYRRVLSQVRGVRNAAVAPTTFLSPDNQSYQLLEVFIATNDQDPNEQLIEHCESELIRYRALCEYFRSVSTDYSFVTERTVDIDCELTVSFEELKNTKHTCKEIIQYLSDALLPQMSKKDFAEFRAGHSDPQRLFEGPQLDGGPCHPDAFDVPSFRKDLIIAEFYGAVQLVPGVLSVETMGMRILGSDADYQHWILKLDRQTFTRLGRITINGELQPLDQATRNHDDWDEPPIEGEDHHPGKFNSLQLSYPENYELGRYFNEPESQKTSSFRRYLALFDQVRANHNAQIGHLNALFSIDEDLPDPIVENHHLADEDFYKRLIPDSGLPTTDTAELANESQEHRLNFLLAMHGVSDPFADKKIPIKKSFELKNDYLNLLHHGPGSLHSLSLNAMFNSYSQRWFRQQLQKNLAAYHVEDVFILEDWMLGRVWPQDHDVNFSITLFLIVETENLPNETDDPDTYESEIEEIAADKLPAHILFRTRFITSADLREIENLTREAYPQKSTYTVTGPVSSTQLEAMKSLLDNWVFPTTTRSVEARLHQLEQLVKDMGLDIDDDENPVM